jgi:hypothetical protein
MNRKLVALLIGINEYETIHSLSGCENDINRVKTFLESYSSDSLQLDALCLYSSGAKKEDIVTTFENHFIREDIEPGDILFFYFAGHGGEEFANQVFWSVEPNQKLQNIACYDSNLSTGKKFLADKELRYLIARAAKPGVDIVTIFDCCHSGNNTKSSSAQNIQARLAGVIPERDWEDFIFADKVSLDTISDKGIENALPQGQHIQMAACNSHELAYESKQGGFFTSGFIKVIEETKGDVNYVELSQRIGNWIKQLSPHPQSPQLSYFDPKINPKQLGESKNLSPAHFKAFLGSIFLERPLKVKAFYSKQDQNWIINQGAIAGVREEINGIIQKVAISEGNGSTILAKIKDIYPGYSIIELESVLPATMEYDSTVSSILFRNLRITLKGEAKGIEALRDFLSQNSQNEIKVVDEIQNPELVVWAQAEQFFITLPNEITPLGKAITGFNRLGAQDLFKDVQKINKWTFIKNLENDGTRNKLQNKALGIELKTLDQPIPDENGHYYLHFSATEQAQTKQISLTLQNRTNKILYVGVVYLSVNFDCSPRQFWKDGDTIRTLEAGGTSSKDYDIGLEEYIIQLNQPEEVFYFKIIASNSEFSLDLFAQLGMEPPEHIQQKGLVVRGGGWETWLVAVHLVNPDYQS